MKFYVYVLCRPDKPAPEGWEHDGCPFYVGKGTRYRILAHELEARSDHKCHKCSVIRKVWREGGQVLRHKVFETNDEQEAFTEERRLIAHFGRENLTNLTDGGEGPAGVVVPAELRERLRVTTGAGWRDPLVRQRRYAGMMGYHRSAIGRAIKSASMKAFWNSPEGRSKASIRSFKNWADPEIRERRLIAQRAAMSTPEYRAKNHAQLARIRQDPEIEVRRRSNQQDAMRDPAYREMMHQITTRRYADPAERVAHGEKMRHVMAAPEVRAAISEGTKAGLASPEVRERISKAQREIWAKPGYRERQSEKLRATQSTPEKRAEYSAKTKAYASTPEGRAQRRESAIAWQAKRRSEVVAAIPDIQALYATGEHTVKELAKRFKSSRAVIERIVSGQVDMNNDTHGN